MPAEYKAVLDALGKTGDFKVNVAMTDDEVTPVLKALRGNGIDVVAMHHHMIGTRPTVIFLHYWGRARADALARGVRAAVDATGARVSTRSSARKP